MSVVLCETAQRRAEHFQADSLIRAESVSLSETSYLRRHSYRGIYAWKHVCVKLQTRRPRIPPELFAHDPRCNETSDGEPFKPDRTLVLKVIHETLRSNRGFNGLPCIQPSKRGQARGLTMQILITSAMIPPSQSCTASRQMTTVRAIRYGLGRDDGFQSLTSQAKPPRLQITERNTSC